MTAFAPQYGQKITRGGVSTFIPQASGQVQQSNVLANGPDVIHAESAGKSAAVATADPNNPVVHIPGEIGGGTSGSSAYPGYLGNNYPTFQPVSFPTTFTDPQKYAEGFAKFNRGQIAQNFKQSQSMALDTLNTELAGLKQYAPAAAALKREQIAQDNPFNQAQRLSQVEAAMPGARQTLDAQGARAAAYAQGRLPDEQLDRALELGIRANAADKGTFSGFGAMSGETSKISDLMSAEERFQIAQYGEGLTTQNLGTEASLFLAPTEYANTGAEISARPEVGAGRITMQDQESINAATMLSPATALSSTVQQDQFNANGQFTADQFNSTGAFTAALGKFQYDNQYVNAVTAGNQQNLNTAMSLGMQGLQAGGYNNGLTSGQNANTITDVLRGIGSIPQAANAINTILGGGSTDTGSAQGSSDTGATISSGKSISTAPSNTSNTAPLSDTSTGGLMAANVGVPSALAVDTSTPNTLKFASAAQVPLSYTPFASNRDGTVSAVKTSDYESELSAFAENNKGSSGGNITIKNAATADRALSSAAGIAFAPMPAFTPVASTTSGKMVYSSPAMAQNGDASYGAKVAANIGSLLASFGIGDENLSSFVGSSIQALADPKTQLSIDEAAQSADPKQISSAILASVAPNLKGDSDAAQQTKFMASRLGEIWTGLSPAQKSAALAAIATGPALEAKTGKKIADEVIPHTQTSVNGGLTVGNALAVAAKGYNPQALARNWNQLSAISNIATGTKGVLQTAKIADAIGALGVGASGSAVHLPENYLAKVGAIPVPEHGVGALSFSDSRLVPKGYQAVTKTPTGQVIALPKSLQHTAIMTGNTAGPLVYTKSQAVSSGKHPAQRAWGKPFSGGVARGSAGGSALIASLNQMHTHNPTLANALTAYSLMNNMLGAD